MKTLDFLFNADYRKLNWVKETAEYYEVTKQGKIIYHENRGWKTPLTKITINYVPNAYRLQPNR